jgi:hypothetical protein
VSNYTVEKPPAQEELEALPDNMLERVVRKLESLSATRGPQDAKN